MRSLVALVSTGRQVKMGESLLYIIYITGEHAVDVNIYSMLTEIGC